MQDEQRLHEGNVPSQVHTLAAEEKARQDLREPTLRPKLGQRALVDEALWRLDAEAAVAGNVQLGGSDMVCATVHRNSGVGEIERLWQELAEDRNGSKWLLELVAGTCEKPATQLWLLHTLQQILDGEERHSFPTLHGKWYWALLRSLLGKVSESGEGQEVVAAALDHVNLLAAYQKEAGREGYHKEALKALIRLCNVYGIEVGRLNDLDKLKVLSLVIDEGLDVVLPTAMIDEELLKRGIKEAWWLARRMEWFGERASREGWDELYSVLLEALKRDSSARGRFLAVQSTQHADTQRHQAELLLGSATWAASNPEDWLRRIREIGIAVARTGSSDEPTLGKLEDLAVRGWVAVFRLNKEYGAATRICYIDEAFRETIVRYVARWESEIGSIHEGESQETVSVLKKLIQSLDWVALIDGGEHTDLGRYPVGRCVDALWAGARLETVSSKLAQSGLSWQMWVALYDHGMLGEYGDAINYLRKSIWWRLEPNTKISLEVARRWSRQTVGLDQHIHWLCDNGKTDEVLADADMAALRGLLVADDRIAERVAEIMLGATRDDSLLLAAARTMFDNWEGSWCEYVEWLRGERTLNDGTYAREREGAERVTP